MFANVTVRTLSDNFFPVTISFHLWWHRKRETCVPLIKKLWNHHGFASSILCWCHSLVLVRKNINSVSDFPSVYCRMALAVESHNHPGLKIDLCLVVITFQVSVVGSFWWFVHSWSSWDIDISQFTELEWNYFLKRKKKNSSLKLLSIKSSLGYWNSFWCCFRRVHLENIFFSSVPCCHLVLGLVLHASRLIFQTRALIQCCEKQVTHVGSPWTKVNEFSW